MTDRSMLRQVKRFRETETRVRRNDPADNVEWIHGLEDEIDRLWERITCLREFVKRAPCTCPPFAGETNSVCSRCITLETNHD